MSVLLTFFVCDNGLSSDSKSRLRQAVARFNNHELCYITEKNMQESVLVPLVRSSKEVSYTDKQVGHGSKYTLRLSGVKIKDDFRTSSQKLSDTLKYLDYSKHGDQHSN